MVINYELVFNWRAYQSRYIHLIILVKHHVSFNIWDVQWCIPYISLKRKVIILTDHVWVNILVSISSTQMATAEKIFWLPHPVQSLKDILLWTELNWSPQWIYVNTFYLAVAMRRSSKEHILCFPNF